VQVQLIDCQGGEVTPTQKLSLRLLHTRFLCLFNETKVFVNDVSQSQYMQVQLFPKVVTVKWVPGYDSKLAVLCQNDRLLVFDILDSLDQCECELNFAPILKGDDNQQVNLVDFEFSCSEKCIDFGNLSLFVLTGFGEILCVYPIIFKGYLMDRQYL